ncbi:MAG: hypothetical protein ACE5FM_00360 [Methyloligellaceae bacterium]
MATIEDTQAILSDFIAHPTVSSDSNLEMIADIANRLGDVGVHVDIQTSADGHKANLFATLGPSKPGGIVLSGHSGLEPATENEARDIMMELTGNNGADVVSFGTQAGIFSELGMSVVVCEPGSIEQAHKPDEFVSKGQLGACLKMLERLKGQLHG